MALKGSMFGRRCARWDESKFGKAWRRLIVHAVADGVRDLRFHDTRHTFASWALASGQSIKWVQQMLGHSSAELTLRTYSHLMDQGSGEMEFLDADPSEKRDRSQTLPAD